jgi:nucleoside-diphosphate-sugar epimerase
MALFTVLGARGFIGSRLVRHLQGHGHEVFAPERRDPEIFQRDLGCVVYCIGLTTDFLERPLDTAEAHVCELVPLLRRARFERLVYLSSVRLYDGLQGRVDESAQLRLDPLRGRHLYDLSKGLGEALVHHSGRPGIVARLASVYDDSLGQDDFLCRTLQRALNGGTLVLDADEQDGRDYIHVDDVCGALEVIGLNGCEPAYNLATGTIFTHLELAALCEHELGAQLSFRATAHAEHPPIVDISRLVSEFGLRPSPPTERLPHILRALKNAGR